MAQATNDSHDTNVVEQLARVCGFDCMGTCEAHSVETQPEVRDMCAANLCQSYGRSWSCPPACGSIKDYEARMRGYDSCLVVQTVGALEDAFDFESILHAESLHKERFIDLVNRLREQDVVFLPLGAGTCSLCAQCTYPDLPCRFPDNQIVSMEAAGLVVNDVCTLAGVPYNHGQDTIAFSSCIFY